MVNRRTDTSKHSNSNYFLNKHKTSPGRQVKRLAGCTLDSLHELKPNRTIHA